MKKLCTLVVAIFFLSSVGIVFAGEPTFSKAEKAKLEFIKKVKKWNGTIGLLPTKNYLEYREEESSYNLFFYSPKTEVPFSYIDPTLHLITSAYNNLKDSVEKYGIDVEKYDTFFYVTRGVAGGTFITRNFLKCSDLEAADAIVHEDFHDNVDLPRHVNEASAMLAGVAGSCLFMKMEQDDYSAYLGFLLAEADLLNQVYDSLAALNKAYKNNDMTFPDYLAARDKRLSFSWYDTVTEVSQNHTYRLFFPLMARLYLAFGSDVKKFILYMKEFPVKDISVDFFLCLEYYTLVNYELAVRLFGEGCYLAGIAEKAEDLLVDMTRAYYFYYTLEVEKEAKTIIENKIIELGGSLPK